MSAPTKARTGCIFLSHSGADTEAAHELAETLRHNGLEVWFDKDSLRPGDPWMTALEQNIQRASAMLVYVGRIGVQSWVDREVRLGLVRNTQDPGAFRLIPVLGEGAEPSSLPPFLAQHQWADLRNPQDKAQQIQRLQQILASSSEERAIAAQYWTTHSPFRGLQVFKPEDAWLFFGRDADTKELLSRLSREPVLAVVGNSGSGKSSLIRAGLIPALKRGRFFDKNNFVESWQVVVLRPSQAPFDYLSDVLPGQLAPYLSAIEKDQFMAHLRTTLPQNTDALRNAIATLRDSRDENVHVLLVVDQFEELFTLVPDRNVHAKYVRLLMATSRCFHVHLVLSIRADFYSHCLEHKELSRCLEANLFNVPRMEVEQLRETIEQRLTLAGATAEAGLLDALLSDVGSEPGDLALLEHALDELWSNRGPDRTLTNQAYARMGRLRGALGRHADQVCRQLGGQNEQFLVQQIFLELVQLGEGAQDTRRRVSKEALLRLGPTEQMEQLLSHLASSRLIQTGSEGGKDFAEVSHEALIREWPALRQWLADNREALRLQRRLEESAEEWRKLKHDPGALLQGVRLDQAQTWLQKHPETRDLLREFVEASGAARAQATRRSEQLEAISAVSQQTTAVLDLDELLTVVCRLLLERFILIHHVAILLCESEGLRVRAHEGRLTPNVAWGTLLPLGRDFASRALSQGTSIICNDVESAEGYFPKFKETQSEMCVPLKFYAEIFGVLTLHSATRGAFDPEDTQPLESVADICAAAIQNANYFDRMRQLAYVDGQTGIHNRRYFEMRIVEELERASRFQGRVAVIMVAIDHFNRLNDEFGHLLGDEVLRCVASILKQQMRKVDMVCFYRGEAFAIVVPETSADNASTVAEKLRRQIELHPFPGVPRPVTISCGVAESPLHGTTRDQVLAAADKALQTAQRGGRNRVCRARVAAKSGCN